MRNGRRFGRLTLLMLVTALALAAGVTSAHAAITPLLPPPLVLEAGAVMRVDLPQVEGETYVVSYDTTSAFTATQTVVGANGVAHFQGVDGVTYYVTYRVQDAAGVSGESPIAIATADGTPPVTRLIASPAMPDGRNGWFVTPVEATMTASDGTGSGGIWKFVHRSNVCPCGEVEFDGSLGLPSEYSTRVVPVQGINECAFYAVDGAGNQEATNTARVMLDSVRPEVMVELSAPCADPTTQSITATATASDGTSGVDRIEWAFLPRGSMPTSGTVWTSVAASSTTFTVPQGVGTLFVRAFDVAGNVSAVFMTDVFSDTTAPVTGWHTDPARPNGINGTWRTAPLVIFHVTDADTMTTTFFAWDSQDQSAFVTGESTAVPSVDGTHTLRYYSMDRAGNRETTKTSTFVLNRSQAASYTITATAGAGGSISPSGVTTVAPSGSATITITPNAGFRIADVLVDGSSVGTHTVHTFSNVIANHTISATFAQIPVPPTAFAITATAGTGGSISPSGVTTVAAGATATLTITPNAGYRISSVVVDGSFVGTHTQHVFANVTANHTISATFVRIAKLPTRCTLRVSATSVRSGRFVTLTARLTGGTFPAGTVVRFEVLRAGSSRYVLLRTVRVNSSGVATLRYRVVARGSRWHRVRYMGDTTFAPSPVVKGTRLRVF